MGSNLGGKKEKLKASRETHKDSESVNEIKDVLYSNHYKHQKAVQRKKNDLTSTVFDRVQAVNPQKNSVMPKHDWCLTTREERVNTLESSEPRTDRRYAQPAVNNKMPNFQGFHHYRLENDPLDITDDTQGIEHYNYPLRNDQHLNQYNLHQAPKW